MVFNYFDNCDTCRGHFFDYIFKYHFTSFKLYSKKHQWSQFILTIVILDDKNFDNVLEKSKNHNNIIHW